MTVLVTGKERIRRMYRRLAVSNRRLLQLVAQESGQKGTDSTDEVGVERRDY